MNELKKAVREFFKILDTVEESMSGTEFHPTYISSCRVMHTEKLSKILPKMRKLSNENND